MSKTSDSYKNEFLTLEDNIPIVSLSAVARYSKDRVPACELDEESYVGVENLLQNRAGKKNASTVPKEGNAVGFACGDVLIGNIRPYLKKIWLADCNGGTNGDVLVIRSKDTSILSPEYLYCVLASEAFFAYDTNNAKGAKMPRGDKSAVMEYKFPLPPLEKQMEIVRILDSFTELTAELATKLSAELTARKQQYEYYRDKLLPFDTNVTWKPLGEIATIARGASPRPIHSFLTDSAEGVNWIKIGDVSPESKYVTSTKERITQEGAKKSRFVKEGDFILSNSMSFGRPYILKINGCIHDGWLSISNFDNYVTPDYLYYILVSSVIQLEMAKRASFGGAVQNLNADVVRNIRIPIPSFEEQNKIVSILDRFNLFCTDITKSLPVEIEARQKQYEYYRDQLLSFTPAE